MSLPRVITVVLNTNRREDTLACLGALHAVTYASHAVIMLDNASSDGSVEAVSAQFPAVQIVPLAENLGYAGNNNVGIRLALEQGADWVFVLNEDTLIEPECLTYLLEAAARHPSAGVLGPMVFTFDEPPVISSAGGVVDWWRADATNVGMGESDTGQYPARPVDFINGCGLLASRAAIEKAGLLDASFFIYFEEADWCFRIRQAGFNLWFEPRARMRHKAPIHWRHFGPSTLYYVTRNRLRFFARHAPLWLKPISMAQAMRGALMGIRQHERAGRPEHARAIRWALRHAVSQHWGKVEPALWRPDATDRTLNATPKTPSG